MIPVIIYIGPFPINSFGLLMVLGFLSAWRSFAVNLEEAGENPELAEKITFGAALGGVLGARVLYLLSNIELVLQDPIGAIFSGSGFIFYGGFIGGLSAVIYILRKESKSFFYITDLMSPALAIGYAVGRIGCHLSGDGDYGKATDMPWGFRYQLGVYPSPEGLFVHPAPVYETLATLLIAGILLAFHRTRRLKGSGQLFGFYMILSAIERFFIEFIRIEPIVLFGLTQAQITAIALLIAGTCICIVRRKCIPNSKVE